MTTAEHVPPLGADGSGGRSPNLTRSWIAVALIPVGFVPAFVVGEGLYALLGHQPEVAPEPLSVAPVAAVPAIGLFLIPRASAVWYGNKAPVEGYRAALLPMVVGVVLGLWMLVMNTVSLFAG
jgi:hypothetical protein